MPKKKQPNSARRLRAAGLHPVQLWLTAEEYEQAKAASIAEERPMAWLLKRAGLKGIGEILAAKGGK